MPKYICKLEIDGVDHYFEWSTIVDAPVTYGMPLEEFREYYRSEHGESGMRDLPERLERVEQKGTSSMLDDSLDDLIQGNRAGEDDTPLNKAGLVDFLRQPPA